MKGHERKLIVAAVGLLVYVVMLSFLGPVMSSILASKTVANTGIVEAIGVGVYSDQQCNTPLTSINWGTIEPGQSVNSTAYLRNEGNNVIILSMSTSAWTPSNANQYITLSWDRSNYSLSVGSVVKATFTLKVLSTVSGISTFSFTITIVGTG